MRIALGLMCLAVGIAGASGPTYGKGKNGGGTGGQKHAAPAHATKTPHAPAAAGSHAHANKAPQANHAARGQPGSNLAASPAMLYGSMMPFASPYAQAAHHAYLAHQRYYGSNRGYRGRGNRGNTQANARSRHLAKLVRDLNSLTIGYSAPAGDQSILRNDLMALSQQGMRPASGPVTELSRDLIRYLPQRKVAFLNTERLALSLETVVNGSRVNAGQVGQSVSAAESILRSSGVAQPGVQAISQAMKSVGTFGLAANAARAVH